jgi:hypothetical protein
MYCKGVLVALSILVGAWVVGCSDSSSESGTGGTGGTADTVTVELQVVQFQPGDTDVPFEGAEVCLQDTENCVTSNEEGFVELDVPASSELTLEVTAEGYGPTLTPVTTTDESPATQVTPLLDEATLELLSGVLGIDYPFTETGVVALSVLDTAPIVENDNGIPGVTMTPDREGSVYYLDENEFPRFDISETTTPSGAGGIVEAEPGTWEITLGGTASNCVVVTGWPGSTDNSLRFPIKAGYFTQAFVTCDPVD